MYEYSDYAYTDVDALAGVLGGLVIFMFVIVLIALALGIVQIIAFWKIYKKAGKNGWEAIIPFYCNWVLVEVAGLNWWWFLLFFAPMLFSVFGLDWLGYITWLVAMFNCYYNISKKFNKGTGFAICFTLFTPICAAILGFSKNNTYDNSISVSNNGCFGPSGTTNNTNMNNNNNSYYQNNVQQPVYNNNINNLPEQTNVNSNVNSQSVQEFSFCGNCGTKLNKDAKFCPNCGKENN